MSERGFTLLEAMVALVILSLVVVSSLELFGASARSTGRAEEWATAVAHAETAMEAVKLAYGDAERATRQGTEGGIGTGPPVAGVGRTDTLAGGFIRTVDVMDWTSGTRLVVVSLRMPSGASFRLTRLVPASRPDVVP